MRFPFASEYLSHTICHAKFVVKKNLRQNSEAVGWQCALRAFHHPRASAEQPLQNARIGV
jgi:hypothetical protein